MKALTAWLPVFAWAALIYALSAVPGLRSPWDAWDFILRKGAHVFEYAVLGLLISRGLHETGPFSQRPWFAAFLAALLYAISDEWHQSHVAGRVGSSIDVGIDSVGAAFGAWLHAAAPWRARG